jgi:hypothetical protein
MAEFDPTKNKDVRLEFTPAQLAEFPATIRKLYKLGNPDLKTLQRVAAQNPPIGCTYDGPIYFHQDSEDE